MSFRICEFKDCLYSLYGKLSKTIGFLSTHSAKQTRILFKVQIALAVLTIFLPCLVDATSICQGEMGQEGFKGRQVPMNVSGVEDISQVTTADFITRENGIPFQVNDLWKESVSELGSSLVEFSDPLGFKGEPIGNPRTKDCANYKKSTRDECYFIGTKTQFWMALLLGGIGGAIVVRASSEASSFFAFKHNGQLERCE